MPRTEMTRLLLKVLLHVPGRHAAHKSTRPESQVTPMHRGDTAEGLAWRAKCWARMSWDVGRYGDERGHWHAQPIAVVLQRPKAGDCQQRTNEDRSDAPCIKASGWYEGWLPRACP